MLEDGAARGAIVLLTGGRRAGKTTLLLAVREAALRAGLSAGGMLSLARFDGENKVGIDVLDVASGARHPLAIASAEPRGPIHTGHYTFDADGMAAGLEFARAGQRSDLFIVDELGPLELVRGEGWAPALPLIRARQFGAALVVVRPELIDRARDALSLPADVPVINITPESRARWTGRLRAWVMARAAPPD